MTAGPLDDLIEADMRVLIPPAGPVLVSGGQG
jgi:hypothetical protein